jgi:uroporphyrinogen-III synthase
MKWMQRTVAEAGIEMDVVPFIKTEGVMNEGMVTELEILARQSLKVVFTSKNAVKEVGQHMSAHPEAWDIFCVGEGTKAEAEKIFGISSIKGIAQNGSELADVIIERGDISEVVFFCGDKRWFEFPSKLKEAGIASREVVVYNTTSVPVTLTKKYDAIMFFSPSGVESFMSANEIMPDTILFAIGKTTARALKGRVSNEVFISDSPLKKQVIDEVIAYFKKETNKNINERINK